jgi:membrane protease YdiL (CAAX protease family)
MRVAGRGAAAYVAIVAVLSWLPAWWLAGAAELGQGAAGSRLLRASLVYALILGWQPVAAVLIVRRWLGTVGDVGLRGARGRFVALSVIAPIVLLAAATALDVVLWRSLRAPVQLASGVAAAAPAASLILGLIGTVAVLWLQAASEELGWRGFLLERLMVRLGPWSALVVHGVLWGLWYAPVFVIGGAGGGARAATFVVTCALLGTLLGWLRVVSGSIWPSAASNATLTLAAGLPVMLQGASSARSAIYEPAGWIPLAVALALIVALERQRVGAPMAAARLPDDLN